MTVSTRLGVALVAALAIAACDGADDAGPSTTSDVLTATPSTPGPMSTTDRDAAADPEPVATTVPATIPASGAPNTGPDPTPATNDGAPTVAATTIAIETDAGTLTVGGDVADAAALAPVPPDATIDLVTTADDVTTVVATSPSTLEELTEFYVAAVRSAGDEPTDTALGDAARRIEGMTSFGSMSTVLAGGPGGSVVITIEITG